jgi:hypothetical protein
MDNIQQIYKNHFDSEVTLIRRLDGISNTVFLVQDSKFGKSIFKVFTISDSNIDDPFKQFEKYIHRIAQENKTGK